MEGGLGVEEAEERKETRSRRKEARPFRDRTKRDRVPQWLASKAYHNWRAAPIGSYFVTAGSLSVPAESLSALRINIRTSSTTTTTAYSQAHIAFTQRHR